MTKGFNLLCRTMLVTLTALVLISPLMACAQPEKADLVVVHKADRVLELWSNGETLAKYHVALGFNPIGRKQFEGDGRTPEGVYTISQRNESSHYYRSLKINYPNDLDLQDAAARGQPPGGMIMIHGLPNHKSASQVGHPTRDWTDGCIAVSNNEMQKIWDDVPTGTAVLIMP